MLFVFFDIVSFFLKKGSKKGNVRKKRGEKNKTKNKTELDESTESKPWHDDEGGEG